jgi:hypothetical protein
LTGTECPPRFRFDRVALSVRVRHQSAILPCPPDRGDAEEAFRQRKIFLRTKAFCA